MTGMISELRVANVANCGDGYFADKQISTLLAQIVVREVDVGDVGVISTWFLLIPCR